MAKQSKKQVAEQAVALATLRERCKTDKLFLSQQLGYDFQPDVHADLFDTLLKIDPTKFLSEQSEIKSRMVLWSRGHYKTTAIVVEMIQLILNFPDIRILLMQGTVKNTIGLLKEVKSHFDGTNFRSNLKDIFPEFCCTDKKLGTQYTFTVPARIRTHLKEGTITVASPKSVKAGQHYEAGFFDDLINEQNFRNPEQVTRAIEDFNLYIPLIDPGFYRYVTGTRYIFGDLYEWILRHCEGWKTTVRACWTVNPDGTKTITFPRRKLEDGRYIGFTLEMLEQIQRDDPAMFSCQYLNQPVLVDTQLFPERLMLEHVKTKKDEKFPDLGYCTLFIDLATSGKCDDSVVLCGQQDEFNRVYVTDGVGGKWTILTLANTVIAQALQHRPISILLEQSAAGTVFKEYLQLVANDKGLVLPVHLIKIDTQKDAKHLRISTVNGALKQNKLFFLAGLPCWENLLEQFTNYQRMKHDDYPDTVALMVRHYAENSAVAPTVRTLAHYLQAAPDIPEFAKDEPDHHDNYGGLGSDF